MMQIMKFNNKPRHQFLRYASSDSLSKQTYSLSQSHLLQNNRSKVKINTKKLPQNFFSLRYQSICNQQMARKLTLSNKHQEKIILFGKQRLKNKSKRKSIFQNEALLEQESVVINDQIQKIRNKLYQSIQQSKSSYHLSQSLKNINSSTPYQSIQNQVTTPTDSLLFEMTFSKDMVCSAETSRQYQQRKYSFYNRGESLNQKHLNDIVTKSSQNNQNILKIKKQRSRNSLSFSDYIKLQSGFLPRLSQNKTK